MKYLILKGFNHSSAVGHEEFVESVTGEVQCIILLSADASPRTPYPILVTVAAPNTRNHLQLRLYPMYVQISHLLKQGHHLKRMIVEAEV